MTPARKGDLAVYSITRTDAYIGQDSRTRVTWEIGTVTKATRDGIASEIRSASGGTIRRGRYGWPDQVLVQSQDTIDVPGAIEAARRHTWPGGQASMPFDSLDDVKSVLRSLVRR